MIDMKDLNVKLRRNLLLFLLISVFFFFGMVKTNAYYKTTSSTNVDVATEDFSDLEFSLDKDIYGSCGQTPTINFSLSNSNDYPVYYNFSFSNTTASYLVDGSALTTYSINSNADKEQVITISGETGTTITMTINVVLPYSKTYTVTINFDNACPVVSIRTTNGLSTKQTATLIMNDNIGSYRVIEKNGGVKNEND